MFSFCYERFKLYVIKNGNFVVQEYCQRFIKKELYILESLELYYEMEYKKFYFDFNFKC